MDYRAFKSKSAITGVSSSYRQCDQLTARKKIGESMLCFSFFFFFLREQQDWNQFICRKGLTLYMFFPQSRVMINFDVFELWFWYERTCTTHFCHCISQTVFPSLLWPRLVQGVGLEALLESGVYSGVMVQNGDLLLDPTSEPLLYPLLDLFLDPYLDSYLDYDPFLDPTLGPLLYSLLDNFLDPSLDLLFFLSPNWCEFLSHSTTMS